MASPTRQPVAERDRAEAFPLLGGKLAVDFVNSFGSPTGSQRELRTWNDLVRFLLQTGILTPEREKELHRLEHSDPQATEALMAKALALRGSLREAFAARISRQRVPAAAIEPVNEILRVTEGHDELASRSGEWRLEFVAREERPEWLLAAIARSAAEILAEGPDAPLRKCANSKCAFLFYDTSRTGRRRWCSMVTCGNRSKVAAFARRRAKPSRRR